MQCKPPFVSVEGEGRGRTWSLRPSRIAFCPVYDSQYLNVNTASSSRLPAQTITRSAKTHHLWRRTLDDPVRLLRLLYLSSLAPAPFPPTPVRATATRTLGNTNSAWHFGRGTQTIQRGSDYCGRGGDDTDGLYQRHSRPGEIQSAVYDPDPFRWRCCKLRSQGIRTQIRKFPGKSGLNPITLNLQNG